MTFREEIKIRNPYRIDSKAAGGVICCPRDIIPGSCKYATNTNRDERCTKCWDREIPDELKKEK